MDLTILQMVARELDQVLRGGFVNKVHQPLPREVILRVRLSRGGEKKLVLSADPKLGRFHSTDLKIPNPPSPPRFCSFLRAHFQGARILRIDAAVDDRTVRIVTLRGPVEARVERDLILELLGRDSNIILVDMSSGLIMDCLHHIPAKETGSRVVMPGTEYTPPPRRNSVQNARPEIGLSEVVPGIGAAADGKNYLTIAAAGDNDQRFPSMNEAADAFYSVRLEAAMLESLRRALAAPVKSRIHSLQRRLGKIEADEARLNQFIERAQEGELLKANLSLVKKGMPRIVVQDWLTGQDRTIDLDPSLNPVENMQRMFKRSAKGQRGRKIVHERREETLREISALQDQLFFTESAQDLTELEALAGDASAVSAEPRRAVEQRADGEKAAASAMFRQHTAPSGRVVLVGKSSRGNEFLVRRKAAKEDLWFHVKDWPGAHVVLRTEGRAPAPPEDIAFAAGLAVRFSGARGKGKVGVIMALVKDLGRPKGGLPGQVTVKRFRTVFAEG